MKGKAFKRAAILVSASLAASSLLFLQLTQSSAPRVPLTPGEGMPSVRLIAEHEPEEIVGLRDRNTRVFRVVRDLEIIHTDGKAENEQSESRIIFKGTNLC